MFFVYIIKSNSIDRFYIGYTSESIEERISKHNSSFYSNGYTSKVDDWTLFYSIECTSASQALKIEKHIKKMKSRKYIENLIKYPEITIKLLARYS